MPKKTVAKSTLRGGSPKRRAEIGQARRERTRQKLLDTAAEILARSGDSGLSIEALMSSAKMARGTFYNYWLSREELMDSLWDYVGHKPFESIQMAHSLVEDPAERLSITARHTIQRASNDSAWGWLIVHLADSDQINMHELMTYPGPDLNAGLQSGRFDFEDLGVARDLVVGTTLAGIKSVLRRPQSPDYSQLLVGIILQALGIPRIEVQEIVQRPLPAAN